MSNLIDPSRLADYVGKEVGLTDWFEIDQQRINRFAEATEDYQYIHVDPAGKEKNENRTHLNHKP